jgi:hypothetical protein
MVRALLCAHEREPRKAKAGEADPNQASLTRGCRRAEVWGSEVELSFAVGYEPSAGIVG